MQPQRCRILGVTLSALTTISLLGVSMNPIMPARSVRIPLTPRHQPDPFKSILTAYSSSATSSSQSWQDVVYSYHDWDAALVMRIAGCENSTGSPTAVDPASVTLPNGQVVHAHGVLQVLNGSFDPIENVEQAHALWLQQGYGAWSSSEVCWA